MTVRFGIHLPLIDFGGAPWVVKHLSAYVREAASLGFEYVCANDHLVFRRPWIDGPTALAAVRPACADMTIATTVTLPVVRGPASTAQLLAALHTLSGGRLVAGVGPGSSAADYAAAGVPFEERWKRFDEAVRVLRVLLGKDGEPFRGGFYSSETTSAEPAARGIAAPPRWISGWGSAAGIRRVGALGDGWLASAYNTTPAGFKQALDRLEIAGRPANTFPNAIATMWLYVTDRPSVAEHLIDDLLAPMLDRPASDLRQGLLIGSAEQCAQKISDFERAGAQRIFLWPVGDEMEQITAFRERVVPLLSVAS